MQLSHLKIKKLLPFAFAAAICAAPMIWPTVLSVEGHGFFGTSAKLTNSLWAKIKAIRPSANKPQELQSLSKFKQRLQSEGRNLSMHGVYVETLNGREPIAAFNENALFNPASVMKVVTSIAALDKLGAEYRFKTEFKTNGNIDPKSGDLKGDLIVLGGGDPAFSIEDAAKAGASLRKLGVSRVTGNLIILGAFTCNENSRVDISAAVLRRNLGVTVQGNTLQSGYRVNEKTGKKLFALESAPLMRVLQEQNAYSVNAMADTIGEFIGGAEAVRRFLVERVGLKEEEVYISRTSGLETNRLTAWGTAKILRGVIGWLQENGYRPEDLMPIAGVDPSTVGGRFTEAEFAGSVVAKTGTLHETDNGAANLAGIAYTKAKGPILFVIYDMAEGRNVKHLRSVQDEFLKNLMKELGGPDPVHGRSRSAD